MKTISLGNRATFALSLLITGQVLAQNLPDEINHPQYLKIYQNLEQILIQKIDDLDQLKFQKEGILKTIAQMEKDQTEIPVRNLELRNIIKVRKNELSQIDSEIMGLEGVLYRILEDLNRFESIISQLKRDLNNEAIRRDQFQKSRNQAAQEIARINQRLMLEIQKENRSVDNLNRLGGELSATIKRRNEIEQEKVDSKRNAEKFKREIVKIKNTIDQNINSSNSKKIQLSDATGKLPLIRSDLSNTEAQLAQVNQNLRPKEEQLKKLKNELARVSPDINRLQNENNELKKKISSIENQLSSLNVSAMVARRDYLENEISGVKQQISQNTVAQNRIQVKIAPVMEQIKELNKKMQQAIRERNFTEASRIKIQIETLQKNIEAQKNEMARLQKESDRLAKSIAARQSEINSLNASIAETKDKIEKLKHEIVDAKSKMEINERKITELNNSNGELSQKITLLESEIRDLEDQRNPLVQRVASLKQQETKLNSQINNLRSEIQKLENENQNLISRVSEMEKFVTNLPETLRRLEAHSRQLGQKIMEIRFQIDREERFLVRIRQDKMNVQNEFNRAQVVLDYIDRDLNDSNRLIASLTTKLNEESANRDTLLKYNQNSLKKLDDLKVAKSNVEEEIIGASQEIAVNEQDLTTIAAELPRLRQDLEKINPQVTNAEIAKNTAERNANVANSQYQSRLTLFQKYLVEAQTLGKNKAVIGTQDGQKIGKVDASVRASHLASENATTHAKWDALRRGYVRGEISGYKEGFEIGLSSVQDASLGSEEGKKAGALRAADYAEMVVKPQMYNEEFDRRLRDDETPRKKHKLAQLVVQNLSLKQSVAKIESLRSIPELTREELDEAAKIITALDVLISQSELEIKNVLNLRDTLSEAQNVYVYPAPSDNGRNVNCSEVYKEVNEFINACKVSYSSEYERLYNLAHKDSFFKNYLTSFQNRISNVYASELDRLYPVYLKEGKKVAKEVGLSAGKEEIYQQSYESAEKATYAHQLPIESQKAKHEAKQLVQIHLDRNPVLALMSSPKLNSNTIFGVAPGLELDLMANLKNIGAISSSGESTLKITEISQNISTNRREIPIPNMAPRSSANVSLLKIKVSENALPGEKVILAGEITHPGNQYRGTRTETFRVETELNVNPSINSKIEMDTAPKVSGIFGIKKHNIDLKISPKFAGVDEGYEFELEEIDTKFLTLVRTPEKTEVLGKNVEKKVRFTYKLDKASKGTTVKLLLTVKNAGKIVNQKELEIRPE